MTEGPNDQLPPARRRRLVLGAAVQALAITTLLAVLYYTLPLEGQSEVRAVIQLVIGLLVVVGIVAWQVRAIIASEFPRMRMVRAVFVAVPFYVFMFAATYYVMAEPGGTDFGEPLSRSDALYFTVTVLSTVGFGDIAPKSELARLVVTVQMVANLILIGLGLRTLLGAAQLGLQRRSQGRGRAGGRG
jgi:voltage-gated potassium channel